MRLRFAFGGAAFIALVAVACADTPTDPMTDVDFDLSAMYGRGATGAMLDPGDLAQYDVDGNGAVCVKTVPEGKGKGAQRTIVKDDKDGVCPGGFELTEVGGELPACEPNVYYPDTESCACPDDAWSPPLPPGYLCSSAS
jgi:hypothetical protein